MDTIYVIDGATRRQLVDLLCDAEAGDLPVRVTVDSEGFKIKAGMGWSAPMGRLDPTCTTGRIKAAVEQSRDRAPNLGLNPEER